MTKLEIKLRQNKDGTITIRVGRFVEHISTAAKTRGQVFDAVKWAISSKGVHLEDVVVMEFMRQL